MHKEGNLTSPATAFACFHNSFCRSHAGRTPKTSPAQGSVLRRGGTEHQLFTKQTLLFQNPHFYRMASGMPKARQISGVAWSVVPAGLLCKHTDRLWSHRRSCRNHSMSMRGPDVLVVQQSVVQFAVGTRLEQEIWQPHHSQHSHGVGTDNGWHYSGNVALPALFPCWMAACNRTYETQ